MSQFDFDSWCELAARDPQGFFRERERVIAQYIDEHPEARKMLLALQSQIDDLRATAGTPARALTEIVAVLGERLDALTSHLRELRLEAERLQASDARRRS